MQRLFVSIFVLALTITPFAEGITLKLPMKEGSLRFAIIGDTGTGDSHQRDVARQLTASRAQFPFQFVLMMGDNMYGADNPSDFVKKFEEPYKPLLDAGVKFYAALGNHDDPSQRFYKPFNMSGEKYYTFKPKAGVRIFALDSNYMDQKQLDWLEKELTASGSDWKICFFHHPLYSSGETHGSNDVLREQLEPRFVKHGVNVVFTGHEHFYERIKPQKGVAYFIAGNSAKLRRGNINESDLKEKGFDQGYTFMLIEIAGDELYFQTISDKATTIDSGIVHRATTPDGKPAVTATPAARK
ncbi:MAG TPA: metallophosphoesterase [Vicinamibacterales bacterium]|nr:metallophosphoesterase [Vicinamibacterales bacterium]